MKRREQHSVANAALLRGGIAMTLATLILTWAVMDHVVRVVTAHEEAHLYQYVAERCKRESATFALAERNAQLARGMLLRELALQPNQDDAFQQLTEHRADGSVRSRLSEFFAGKTVGLWVSPRAPLTSETKRRAMVFERVIEHLGPAWMQEFPNLYILGAENYAAMFYPGYAWAMEAPADLDLTSLPSYRAAATAASGETASRWTDPAWDATLQHWFVSCATPVLVDGKLVAVIGQDIVVDDLFNRTLKEAMSGSYNLLVARNGALVAHPTKMEQIRQGQGRYRCQDDPSLHRIYELARHVDTHFPVIEDRSGGQVIGVSPIQGPDWLLITVYARQKITQSGTSAAWMVLRLGLSALLLEVLLLSVVLRRRITEPLQSLIEATNAYAQRRERLPLPVGGNDELATLARDFSTLQDTVERQLRELIDEVERRRQSEVQLRASEERYELVARGSTDGVWDWDLRTMQVYFSPRWKALLGYEDHELENSLEMLKEHVHPEDLPGQIHAMEAHLKGRRPVYNVEFRMRHKDGSWRWIQSRGVCVRDADGVATRVAGSHQDITERKQTEAFLADQRMVLEQIARGVPLDVLFDSLLTRIHANAPKVDGLIYRLSHDGRTFELASGPTLPPAVRDAWSRIGHDQASPIVDAATQWELVVASDVGPEATAAGYQSVWALPLVSSESVVGGVLAALVRTHEGLDETETGRMAGIANLVGIAVDRDRTEHERQHRARRTEALNVISRSLAGVRDDYHAAVHDVVRQMTVLGADTCLAARFTPAQHSLDLVAASDGLAAMPTRLRRLVCVDDPQAACSRLYGSLVQHSRVTLARVEPAEGEAGGPWHDFLAVPLRAQGEPIGLLALWRTAPGPGYEDVEVVFAQEVADRVALAISNAELYRENLRHVETLEQRVAERTAELADAMEHLNRTQDGLRQSERLASLGSMVAGVAHELNTPIGNSVTVASTLGDHVRAFEQAIAAGGLRRSDLQRFLEQSQQAAELLGRNLTTARELVAGFKQVAVDQTSEQRRSFDLPTVLTEVLATLRPNFKKTPYALRLGEAEAVQLDSFPGPLGQAITNLVNNALVHGLEGAEHGEVVVATVLADDGQARVVVRDNGRGIAPELLPRIYDPFVTTKLGQGGSGLGLNIVHTIVTGLLGGSIAVESALGQGTTFTLTLPLTAPERTAAPSAGADPAARA